MHHPPYHLRTNKAVERSIFIEALRLLGSVKVVSRYVYYGMGSAYLEDFRLFHENFPDMKMVSIEKDAETHKRQQFHLPCSQIDLQHEEVSSFLARYDADEKKSIFWLDYTDLEYSKFEDFETLLRKVADYSIVKITLKCQPKDYTRPGKEEEFKRTYRTILPAGMTGMPVSMRAFGKLLQDMLQIVAERAFTGGSGKVLQPISSSYYADTAGMYTLTGVVCPVGQENKYKKKFSKWHFANLDWQDPHEINVPILSHKERLHLQCEIPCGTGAGDILYDKLGYNIDASKAETVSQLNQYAELCRHYPHFIRAIL